MHGLLKGVSQTFLLDLPVMILFGALFAYFGDLRKPSALFYNVYFWHGLVFTTIFNVAVVYSALTYPDWMWMYFLESTDAQNSLSELLYLFLFLYYLQYVFGFMLGQELKKLSTMLWGIFVGLQILAEAWLIVHFFDRYRVIGTRDEFLAGSAVSLFGPDNPISLVMNGSVVVMILYFIVVASRFKKRKSRLA